MCAFDVFYTGIIGESRVSTFLMSQDGGLHWKAVSFVTHCLIIISFSYLCFFLKIAFNALTLLVG